MADITHQIKTYYLEFFGISSDAEDTDRRARVLLFKEAKGKKVVADIGFYQPQKLWMKQDRLEKVGKDSSTIIGHMAVDEIAPVIETLRSEEPVFVLWLEKQNQLSLRTHLEPIGEEERKRR
jgi:hypothetical protein